MTPAYRIEVDGKDMTTAWLSRLLSLEITDEAGTKSDALDVTFDDRVDLNGGLIKPPKPGAEIKVWMGYEPAPVYRGKYKVEEWEKSGPTRTLRVSAKASELTSEIRASKIKSWDDTTLGEIAQDIAGKHSLEAVVDPDLAAVEIKHIDQQHESDMGFLSRLARRSGGTFKLADGKVILAKKGSGKLPSGKDKPNITITPDRVSSWSATQGKRGEYKSVVASYMDHGAGKRKSATAGSGTPQHRLRTLYGSASEAKAAAECELGNLTRGQMTIEVSGEGNPNIIAEGKITLKGFDPDVDGTFLIKSIRHSGTTTGYSMSISAETSGSEDTQTATA